MRPRPLWRAAALAAVLAWAPPARAGEPLKTYGADGRAPLETLYASMDALAAGRAWVLETVFVDQGLPIKVLRTKRKGPAVWLIAGIHGEEPAPPNAVARSSAALAALAAKEVPVVLWPLCNPAGYSRNWRYPDVEKYSEAQPGHSVGDSDHLLAGKDGRPRAPSATSPQADALTGKVLALAREYPPVLSVDLHEDNLLEKGYVYSQGPGGREDPAAKALIGMLVKLDYPILLSGKTRFDEPIEGGLISDVSDGSVDELLASETVLVGGKPRKGPAARTVVVVETSAMKAPLAERVRVHASVIGRLEELFRLAASRP